MGGRLHNANMANMCLSNFICLWPPVMASAPMGPQLRNAVKVYHRGLGSAIDTIVSRVSEQL